jgi:hypothetical protein
MHQPVWQKPNLSTTSGIINLSLYKHWVHPNPPLKIAKFQPSLRDIRVFAGPVFASHERGRQERRQHLQRRLRRLRTLR